MKKILMILCTSMALAACGDGTNRSEANRGEEEKVENTEPPVSADENMQDENTSTDSLSKARGDTTANITTTTPSTP
jgi:hypothetical protein